MMGILFLFILVVMILGALPRWDHSRDWGYAPSSNLGLALLVVLFLVVTGRM